MRDAKRLINLFQSDYQMVNGEVDVIDFLLLTIIKYRYRDEYTALFRLEYVEDGSNQTFQYNKKEVTNICTSLNEAHGIPIDVARDIFCLTKDLVFESEFIIYCFILCVELHHTEKT